MEISRGRDEDEELSAISILVLIDTHVREDGSNWGDIDGEERAKD